MNSIRVLCVENEPGSLAFLKFMLESAGHEVLCAATGAQALVVFSQRELQGVLLEHDLPDVTGSALRAEMRRLKPAIPILLFCGVGSETPFLIRFFDSYLRNRDTPWALDQMDS